jgi:hypothetical protein
MVVVRILWTVPTEEGLVGLGCRTTLHTRGDGTRHLSCRTVPLLEIPRPKSDTQVLPAVDDGAGSEGPQELLQFLLELRRNAMAESRAVW